MSSPNLQFIKKPRTAIMQRAALVFCLFRFDIGRSSVKSDGWKLSERCIAITSGFYCSLNSIPYET